MPYIRIIQGDTIDRAAHRAVKDAIDLDRNHPLGLMLHAAGEVDGRWQIVSVWEAREYAEQFDREFGPTIERFIGAGFDQFQVTGYEVEYLLTP
jgi:hypothetical protein